MPKRLRRKFIRRSMGACDASADHVVLQPLALRPELRQPFLTSWTWLRQASSPGLAHRDVARPVRRTLAFNDFGERRHANCCFPDRR